MRRTLVFVLFAFAALTTLGAVDAAAVTEFFTGYVSKSNDAAVPVGTPITGELQLEYDGGAPVSGSIGSASGWRIDNPGDLRISWLSITAGSYNYFTGQEPQLTPQETLGYINGSASGIFVYDQVESDSPSGLVTTVDTFEFSGSLPLTSDGFPVWTQGDSSASGYFIDYSGNNISYTVTNMGPVPNLTPVELLSRLKGEVAGVGPGDRFEDKVERAQDRIQSTCADLNALVTAVTSKDGKKVSQAAAIKIVGDAQLAKLLIGCQ